ncbi:hypothetical protein AYO44_05050 [Planctomycetaceae bacterium SCGC AG-212-F19]|nr:hypothetical protein AYO44_05050 [Planctomycetaceae bacterium SCGC AG-212-F19]
MGLFSSVLHVRDKPRESLLPALDTILRDAGFSRVEALPITAQGPYALPNHDGAVSSGPYYLVSRMHGHWLTVIEAHFALSGAPHLADLGNRLSAALSCYALALVVHDDDLFFYNLDRDAKSLDGYNSCPQYFEQERLPDAKIEEQRHTPEPFQPLLPAGRSLEELRALLNRGWWNAYDSGNLDENGIAQGDDDGFVFEGERMSAFGTLLQLHGDQGEYPYAGWGESTSIAWPEFVALRYRT